MIVLITNKIHLNTPFVKLVLLLILVLGWTVTSRAQKVGEKYTIIEDAPSLGLLQVETVDQNDRPTWARVSVEFPNGREVEAIKLREGRYFVEVPASCKGKELVVYVEKLRVQKHRTTAMFNVGEELVVSVVVRSSTGKHYFRYIKTRF